MTQIACLRCSALTTLEIIDEDETPIEGTAHVADGMLAYICKSCMTNEEVLTEAKRACVALLDSAEEAIDSLNMIFERIPKLKDDARFKESYASAEKFAEQARDSLRRLLGDDS